MALHLSGCLSLEEQEEKQHEHDLMPTIIARFSELGAVIESQKRHIDLWKVRLWAIAMERGVVVLTNVVWMNVE